MAITPQEARAAREQLSADDLKIVNELEEYIDNIARSIRWDGRDEMRIIIIKPTADKLSSKVSMELVRRYSNAGWWACWSRTAGYGDLALVLKPLSDNAVPEAEMMGT